MSILILGGTGLLGAESAWELIKRGNKVSALPPIPDADEMWTQDWIWSPLLIFKLQRL